MEKSNDSTTVVLIIGVFLLLIGLGWRIQDKTVENSPIFKNRKESTTKESTQKESTQKESDKTFKSGAGGVGGVTGAGTKFRNAPSDQFNKIIVSNAAGDMNTIDRNNITLDTLNLTGSAVVNGDMRHNGHTIFNGQTSFKGNAIGQTHFPYTGDGRNYIRGDTVIDGKTNINGQLHIRGPTQIDGNLNVNGDIIIANQWLIKYRPTPAWDNKAHLFIQQIDKPYGIFISEDGIVHQRSNDVNMFGK
jgi:hypothetical protein